MRFRNLTFIGTSHIAQTSLKKVKEEIAHLHPAIVALELDQSRLHTLLHPTENRKITLAFVRAVGAKGAAFAYLASWAQRKLGSMIGTTPGGEMLAAYKEAQLVGSRVALIDQEITMTLQRLSRALSWKEKARFAIDVIRGFFEKNEKIDLRSVPEDALVETLLSQVKHRYPNVYRVLVTERNKFMAAKLCALMTQSSDQIVAVMGAGHVKHVNVLVQKYLKKVA